MYFTSGPIKSSNLYWAFSSLQKVSRSGKCYVWSTARPLILSSSSSFSLSSSLKSSSCIITDLFPSFQKVSRSGKRYVKHAARVGLKDETARPPNVVRSWGWKYDDDCPYVVRCLIKMVITMIVLIWWDLGLRWRWWSGWWCDQFLSFRFLTEGSLCPWPSEEPFSSTSSASPSQTSSSSPSLQPSPSSNVLQVPLFRLNSVLKQPGRRDEDDEEPERQQWDK